MKKTLIMAGALALIFPITAFAQPGAPLINFIQSIQRVVEALIPIVSLLVVIAFFWGLAKYVLSAGDAEKAAEGKSIMIWGVLALFVMISIYGIVGFIQKAVGTDQTAATQQPIVLPDVNP